jgi:hypothetical protein
VGTGDIRMIRILPVALVALMLAACARAILQKHDQITGLGADLQHASWGGSSMSWAPDALHALLVKAPTSSPAAQRARMKSTSWRPSSTRSRPTRPCAGPRAGWGWQGVTRRCERAHRRRKGTPAIGGTPDKLGRQFGLV